MIFSSTCLCLTAHRFTYLFADFLCLPACRTVSVCLPACLTVSVNPHTRLSAYMSHCLCLPACLFTFLPACLPAYRPTTCQLAYLRVFQLSFSLHVCSSVCLSYCLPASSTLPTLVPLPSLPVIPSA